MPRAGRAEIRVGRTEERARLYAVSIQSFGRESAVTDEDLITRTFVRHFALPLAAESAEAAKAQALELAERAGPPIEGWEHDARVTPFDLVVKATAESSEDGAEIKINIKVEVAPAREEAPESGAGEKV